MKREAEAFKRSLVTTRHCRLSVVSLVEATIVIERRRGADGGRALDELLVETEIEHGARHCGTGRVCAASLAPIRQGQPSCRAQLR